MAMVSKKVESALNRQVLLEAESSQFYLAMASWSENQGLIGTSEFLYRQSDEERLHMLKLVRYINERGGKAIIPALSLHKTEFKSVSNVFETLLKHEINVTLKINEVVGICLDEKDYTTHNFMQWFVSEQIEEEGTARSIMDKIKLIGDDKGGLYLFDRDLQTLAAKPINVPTKGAK